ncbi:MAG: glycosyltransferase family 4 protein [Luteibaculaceae bacterium]
MNILLLTDGISPYVMGGMQKHSCNLAKYMAKSGARVTLVHFNQSEFDIKKLDVFTEQEKENIVSIVIPFPKSDKMPGHYLRSSYRYSELIFEELHYQFRNFDFIIAKGFTAWYLLEKKVQGFDCPPVGVNFHGYEMYQKQPNIKSRATAWVLRSAVQSILNNADYVFSYGGKITALLQEQARVSKRRIIEIPGGIERSWLNQNQLIVHNPRRFVFVGRYERRKGIEELHEALSQLPASVQFEFTFIGPIPSDKQLQDPRIKYLGSIREPEKLKQLLQQQDVLVCPSHSEGMPNVILEGMASGLAIIATDVGAVKLLVTADNGTKIKLSNLMETLEQYTRISDSELESFKKKSLDSVHGFLWEEVVAQNIKAIEFSVNK